MLIWIHDSVISANLAEDDKACRGIAAILDAVSRGQHYVLASRQTLKALSENQQLASANRATARILLSNYTLLGSIPALVRFRIVVTFGKSKHVNKVGSEEWEVPLHMVADCCIHKSVLVAENLTDAGVFEQAARQYMAAKGIRTQLSVEKLHGGGSTIPKVFENHAVTEKRWCLCITDSDRICPNDSLSQAAEECKAIASDSSLVATHMDLPVREVENVIPIALLDEVIPPSHRDKWEWHTSKLCRIRRDAHSYCDMKKGLTIRKILDLADGSGQKRYWLSVARDLLDASALESDCLASGECSQKDPGLCHCDVVYGFGDRMLDQILTILNSRGPHESERRVRHDLNRDTWFEVGQLVFEWACAPQEIRS